MILIFGGAYQGKLEYGLETFGKSPDDVFSCTPVAPVEAGSGLNDRYEVDCDGKIDCQVEIDWTKPVIYGLENWVWLCTLAGMEAQDILAAHREELENKIIISADVSQGLVPMDAGERAFREMIGRTLLYLGREADQVHRVFCGLGQRIK